MAFNYISKSDELIKCPCCDEDIDINIEADLEEESSDEREMGTETQYGFTQEYTCPECGNSLEIVGEVWEYPIGVEELFQITNINSKCKN